MESNTNSSNSSNRSDEPTDSSDSFDVRTRHEVVSSRDAVRSYSADGKLYAYRDGDEHIVVSRGREPRDQWVKRVPAERTAVSEGEKLWAIPDNWRHKLTVQEKDGSRCQVYRIPETNVDVQVGMSRYDRLVDAWYSVEAVGTLTAEFADECDWNRLNTIIEEIRSDDNADSVVRALEAMAANRQQIEQKIAKEVNLYALDAVRGSDRDYTPRLTGWVIDPWVESWRQRYSTLFSDILAEYDIDAEVRNEAIDVALEEWVIPYYPAVRVRVSD